MTEDDVVFPHDSSHDCKYGIRIRDYIAIQAMTGLDANPDFTTRAFDDIADMAYKQADAMIKRSNQ